MSISYPLTPPSTTPQKCQITAQNLVGTNVSPFTGQVEVQLWQGEWLELSVTFAPTRIQTIGEQWASFFLALRGQYGTFVYGDPIVKTPLGSPTGTPLVNGATASGSMSIVTDGWTASKTVLKQGDYFQIGTSPARLYKVIGADVTSDASGNATINVFPRVREAIANNAQIITTNPKGTWMLTQNKSTWAKDESGIYTISFTAREAF